MYDQAPIARLLDALVRMSRHPEHRMRLLFLKVCGALVQRQLVSSVAMRDYLLPRATELAIDPVANIRLATVRLFRHIGRLLNGDRTLATFASVVVSRLRNDADRDVRSAVLDLEAFCPHRITLPQIERSASSNESIMNYEMEHAVDAYIHDMETVDLDIIEDELDDPMLNDTPLPMEVQGDYIHFDVEDFAEYCIKKNNDEVEAVNAPFLLEESDHISTLNLTGLKSYEDGKSNEDGNDTDDHATAASTLRLSLVSPTASEDSTVSPATPTSLSLPDYLPSSTLILSSDLNGMPTAKPLTPGTERTLDLESESTLEEENTSSTETSTITTEVEENVADTTNEPAPLSILTKLETTNDTVDDELESELIELNSPLELASLVNLSDEATLPADDVIDRGINGIKESTEAESTVHIPPIASDLHRTERRKSFEAASLAISSRRYSSDESRSTTLNKSIHSLNTTSSSIVATSPSLSKKVITNGILSPTNTTTATSNNTTNTNSPGKQSPVSDNGERDIDGSCSPVPSHSEEDNPSCVETDQRTDKNLMVPG
ncbi:hypothetical protein BDF19DRAFT_266875 [Syncephalis fuscata]|nr:hypothetical protein BDF19DRAFT_266875 [Syncephalis fuscata]